MTRDGLYRARGFSLMELLVTVTILLIVAAIAVPNYRNHVIRANRSEAAAALQTIAAAQEKFYMQNNTYTNSFAADGGLGLAMTTRHYDLEIVNADRTAFEARARPRDGQAQDTDCWIMSIDHQGRMLAQDNGAADTTARCFR